MADGDRDALIASAARLGLSPVEWGGLLHYESGMDPTRWGGAGGRHVGVIQFGPAEQQQFGVTGRETFQEQLPKAEAFMTARGFRPGMGLLDAYSTVNAGSPGRYNASDAGNGGMPGTVADKVRDQFGPHFAKAASFLGGSYTPTMTMPGAPVGSGHFGLSGIELSAASAPTMTTPAPAKDDGPDYAGALAGLLKTTQPAAAAQPAPSAPIAMPKPRGAPFDLPGFLARLTR